MACLRRKTSYIRSGPHRPNGTLKCLDQKIDLSANFSGQLLATGVHRVDAQFDRPELRKYFDQGAGLQMRSHQK